MAITVMSLTDSPPWPRVPRQENGPNPQVRTVWCATASMQLRREKFLAMDVNQRAQLGKERRLCFSCFESTDHQPRDCTRKKRCDMGSCDKYHHPLIHGAAPVFVGMPSVNNPPPVPPLNATAPVFVGASSVSCVFTAVLLQIVPIVVATPKGVKVSTFALLDSGSQTSLILENFADAIGLDGGNGPLQLGTINSSGRPARCAQIAVEEAWTVPQLNLPPQKVTHPMIQDFPHLNNLSIPKLIPKT